MFKIFYEPIITVDDDIDDYILTVNNNTTIKEIKKEILKRHNTSSKKINIYIYISNPTDGYIKKYVKNKQTVGELNLEENSVLYII
jgi:ribosomal protein L23